MIKNLQGPVYALTESVFPLFTLSSSITEMGWILAFKTRTHMMILDCYYIVMA